ncbi:MAG: amino acid adenylation domain-containing protein [Acidimicrobiales bacterium]
MTADPGVIRAARATDEPSRHGWTHGPDHSPPGAKLADLIVAQAVRTPDAVAIRQWDAQLSYRELVGAAAQLATRLRRLGCGPEVRVGVCVRRTPQLPIAALGVMLAGGAYVPLDPAHPRRRLDGILDDATIPVVVADEAGQALLAGCDRSVVEPPPVPVETLATPRPVAGTPANAAYVLYTSGSTGRPKGVVVSHRSVASFVTAAADRFALDGSCRSVAFSALGFDVSVLDLFAPLTRGASVQLVGDDDRIDPARLQRFLESHEVTWGFLPPALLPLLEPESLPQLRDLVVAGEPPGPEQVERWSAPPQRRLHNWYGPTEATVCVVGTELSGGWDRPVPIGRPLPGCRAYIVDEVMRPCPPGIPGELQIGGPQVARGYLGRPGLTADRFVPDPHDADPGARLYRTGDLAMWGSDGQIEFVGRLDRQVKVQGQRVELGEVEAVVRSHPAVLQAVVDAAGNPPELVAYLAPATAPGLADLRDHCHDRLPTYMLPTRAVRLDALPLNASGKVDLAALRADGQTTAAPAAPTAPAPPAPPGAATARTADTVEQRVAEIWAHLLECGPPSPADDFFACGGHSLRAMRLVAALREELGCDIAVEDVFAARTLSGLVERVRAAGRADDGVRPDAVPSLSPAQYRLWFVEQLAPGTTAHNVAMAERLHGPVDPAALRAALAAVVARHEVLRWRVRHRGGVPYVTVDQPADVALPVDDLSGLDTEARDGALADVLDHEAQMPFDLASGPLLRSRLVRLDHDVHVLVVTVHHLVFDGWSQDVFYRDLALAYSLRRRASDPQASTSTGPFEPLPVGFDDYVAWLRQRTADDGARHVRWWKEHLADASSVLDLPRDGSRPAVQTFGGASCRVDTGAELAPAVAAIARRLNATPYAVLLAAFGQLMRRLTGQHDLVVGTPYADRRRQAFEPLVGMCLQILPLRLRTDDDAGFAEHVRRSQQEVADAIEHCDAPLERIVESLGLARDLTRSPLIQVLFNMYNFATPRLDLDGCTAEPLEAGLPGSLFDLTMYVSESPDGLTFRVVYNPDLFSPERMRALLDSYVALLASVVREPDEAVGHATLRPAGSRLPGWHSPLPAWDGPGVVELVEQATPRTPDHVAVAGAGGSLTYRELDDLRRATASAVRDAGIDHGGTVAVLATRHVALPALLLGVLTAGGRWAILDPAHPASLLARQATAAEARVLLCCPGVEPGAELAHLPVVASPTFGDPATPGPGASEVGGGARGYLVFTSGTTGDPKVVVAPERPLAHFLDRYVGSFDLGPDDRFALLSGLAHDPALRDMFTPLTVGGRLCVPDQDWLRDPGRLAAWLADEQVSVAHLTPQLARLLYRGAGRELPALRLVLLGGDQTVDADVMGMRRLAPAADLVNVYGTTETPQVHAWYHLGPARDGHRPVPVGSGIDGSVLVVVDPSGRPAGVGELGEVVVRSRYLADGYLDPRLTAERFAPTPGAGDADDRRYRTGDLGRYRPDGSVELAGRIDDQVKIRGFRVELGEVEAALRAHPDVRAACAVSVAAGGTGGIGGTGGTDGSERAIRAYATPARPGVHPPELLEHLRARLPEHAVPTGVELLATLPLTPNGKVDRTALPVPTRGPGDGPAGELATDTEQAVAEVWRLVLGRGQVGPTANFFELGGDSLAIVALQARLRRQIGREVSVVDLFRFPTVRALAAHLDGDAPGPGLDRAARRAAMRRARLGRRRDALTTDVASEPDPPLTLPGGPPR